MHTLLQRTKGFSILTGVTYHVRLMQLQASEPVTRGVIQIALLAMLFYNCILATYQQPKKT